MSVSTRIDGVLFVRDWGDGTGQLTFWCPGCDAGHTITYGGADTWTWDGNAERPTFSPSVLAFPHRTFIDEDLPMGDEPGQLLHPSNRKMTPRCHSFVRDGRIEYLGDCEHAAAGTTVDMVSIPARYQKFLS